MTFRKILVLMAVGCLLTAVAYADTPSMAAGASGNATFAEPDGGAVVLYDQVGNPSGNGVPDQDFEASYDAYDSEAADDFDVDWPDGWDISGVNTVGTTGGGASSAVNVTFYTDNGGTPLGGTEVCSYPGVTDYTDVAGSLSINLDPPCHLDMGLHWVAIQTSQNFGASGQHFWSNRTDQANAPSHWRNPGNGFGNGCTDWDTVPNCAVGGSFPDLQFQIVGTQGVPPLPDDPTIEVPTLGQFGLAALILSLLGAGVARLRRRNS